MSFKAITFTTTIMTVLLSVQGFSGNLTGKINFKGTPTAKQMIKMNADPKCFKMHGNKDVASEQTTVNSNGSLKDVFIYVKKGLEGKTFPTPTEKVTIDQKGCMYTPHVFGIMAKQQLEIVNNDPVIHNIHALPKNSPAFNIGQPKMGQKNVKTFDKPEIMVKVKCDVHPWMGAWVGVLNNPFYAVSDDKGNYTIKGLPAGEYDLEAWHEKFGTQILHVKVGGGDTNNADFTFNSK
ncbi:MAG: carboxypeptidase regulatory-like domain-containing protein [Bacteroidota bacterium]